MRVSWLKPVQELVATYVQLSKEAVMIEGGQGNIIKTPSNIGKKASSASTNRRRYKTITGQKTAITHRSSLTKVHESQTIYFSKRRC